MNDDIYRQNSFIQHYSTNMIQHRQSTTGILQLNLHITDDHLTLKIIRVKGLSSSFSHILVKITIIPDLKPLECYTRIVPYKHHTGIFNEKFTFEINDDDICKRLCLSIYDSNQMNFQGCLSFGIRNTLKKQKIQGWFYLLPEDIGEYRHKQISKFDEKFVSKINRDIADLEEYQFTIPRGSNHSFGFTVVGDSPTFIGKVTENSPAALYGLKSGDFIVKINGQNVSRAQQRTVSNLIKRVKHSVTLDIHRYPSVSLNSFDSSTCSNSSISHRPFVDLGQLGTYIESKPISQIINSSIMAMKGSPTNTFI